MNQADTAWMLISTALVLLMTPALAFFYGGLVRSKNALNTMMMSFISLGFVAVVWALLGYSLAFSTGSDWLGDLSLPSSQRRRPRGHVRHDPACAVHGLPGHVLHHHRRPDLGRHRRAHALLRLHRLHHAVVLVVYSADRALGLGRRLASEDGRARLRRRHRGARERRGGGPGRGDRRSASARTTLVVAPAAHVPLVLLGAGLLWFGWFGFNAGSALAASPIAGLAFVTTMLAPAATLVVWTLLDFVRLGKATAVGAPRRLWSAWWPSRRRLASSAR